MAAAVCRFQSPRAHASCSWCPQCWLWVGAAGSWRGVGVLWGFQMPMQGCPLGGMCVSAVVERLGEAPKLGSSYSCWPTVASDLLPTATGGCKLPFPCGPAHIPRGWAKGARAHVGVWQLCRKAAAPVCRVGQAAHAAVQDLGGRWLCSICLVAWGRRFCSSVICAR